jgi:outer membrane scaffolding protein for murein synthesis (MipA/OmpV family)
LSLVLSCFVSSAYAQNLFGDWQNSPGIVLRPLGGPTPDWMFTVGTGVMAQPAYEGSNSIRLNVAPDFDVRYKDIAYASIGEGIGVNLWRGTTYRAGVGLTYDMGRMHSAATRLSGTGNIDPAPVAKVFVQYTFLPIVLSADLKQALTSYQGLVGEISAYMPVVANEKLQVFVGPQISFADSRYMQAYFGVTQNHAAPQSRYGVYKASAGPKDAKFGVSAFYHFNDHWFVDGTFSIQRLLGSAAGSPLVQTRWGPAATTALNYTF